MKEVWKDIPNYEGYYQVSNLGNVKSLKKWCGNKYISKWKNEEKNIRQATHYHGYKYVYLSKNKERKKKYVHRLVAETFIPNPNNLKEINHIDGNKQNNSINNLEWCTRKENVIHSYKNKLLIAKRGKDNKNSKAVTQYDIKGNIIKEWYCIKDVTRELGIADISISRCCRNKQKTAGNYIWKYKK